MAPAAPAMAAAQAMVAAPAMAAVREAAVMARPHHAPAMAQVMAPARICPCLMVDGARPQAIDAPGP